MQQHFCITFLWLLKSEVGDIIMSSVRVTLLTSSSLRVRKVVPSLPLSHPSFYSLPSSLHSLPSFSLSTSIFLTRPYRKSFSPVFLFVCVKLPMKHGSFALCSWILMGINGLCHLIFIVSYFITKLVSCYTQSYNEWIHIPNSFAFNHCSNPWQALLILPTYSPNWMTQWPPVLTPPKMLQIVCIRITL